MFKVKKTAALLLAGILTVSSFAGCSKPAASSGAAGTTSKSSTPVVLKAYMLGQQQKGLQQVLDKVNAITMKDINASIKITFMDFDSYDDKTKLILSSGEDCDIMFSAGWLHYPTYVGQNAYKPLDDLLNQYGSDIKSAMQDGYFKAVTVKGKIYAIPTNKDNAGTAGFIINKKIADKYKMDFSKLTKPADIIPFLETIKKNEPNMIPFVGMHGDNILSIPQRAYYDNDWCFNLGLPKDGTTKMVNTFDDSRMMDAVKVAREIYQKGLTNADIATTQSVTDYENKQKGFCWIETLKPGKADEMESQLGYDVIQVNGYGSEQKPTHSTGDFISSMLSIPNSSKHADVAMQWINEYFKSKDMQNLLAWGIEGQNYVKNSDGRIQLPSGVTSDTNGYSKIYQWAMGGNQFNDLLWKNEATDKWTKMKEWDDSAIKNPLVGLNFDTTGAAVQNEIAALTTVGKQYYYPIEAGSVDFATTYPKLEAANKAAGYDSLKVELQKQIDAFLASSK